MRYFTTSFEDTHSLSNTLRRRMTTVRDYLHEVKFALAEQIFLSRMISSVTQRDHSVDF
jgi:hypothetical protein